MFGSSFQKMDSFKKKWWIFFAIILFILLFIWTFIWFYFLLPHGSSILYRQVLLENKKNHTSSLIVLEPTHKQEDEKLSAKHFYVRVYDLVQKKKLTPKNCQFPFCQIHINQIMVIIFLPMIPKEKIL